MNMSTCSLCTACIMLLKRAVFLCRLSKRKCFFVQTSSSSGEAFSDDPQCGNALPQHDLRKKKKKKKKHLEIYWNPGVFF